MLNLLSILCSKFVSAPQINFAEVLEASWTVILAFEQALYLSQSPKIRIKKRAQE